MAPKKERDEAIAAFTSRVLTSMLEETLMDVVLQSHQEIARARSVCGVCHTRCGSVHVPGSSSSTQGGASTRPSPPDGTKSHEGGTAPGTGANTPTNGNVYYDCTACGRPVASNRFAPHLSGCMRLGGSRRGAGRSTKNQARLPSDAGRANSPYQENGHLSDDAKTPTKNKGKSKANREDEAEFSVNRKRTGSPSISPLKKSKKQKTGSPISRVKTDPDISASPLLLPVAHTNSQTKIPSRLRESSVMSARRDVRRSSSPDSNTSSPAHSASTPSVFSVQSPLLSARAKPNLQNGHAKQRSPVRPPSPVNRIEHDFLVDVDGDETGSSTDSDSS